MIDLGKLVVWFVTCLILYIGYTAQYVMLIHLEGWNTTSFTILGIYNILVIAVLYNYYLACTVDPGRVPAKWEPEPDAPVIEVKKSNHQPRFCKSCQGYKPPRSHHCSSCERCVLKMDHHCPWLNNCVGFYNYGHFIRFIFYVDVACGLCFFILVKRTIQLFDDSYMYRNRENITNFELGLLATNLIAVVPVLLCVSMLSLFQFYGMGENTTTIEGWEKDKVANLVSKGKVAEVRFPYDVGILSNIKSVLGNNIFLWLIPQPMHGDGLSFPVTQYADEGTLIWPPPEYSKDREQSRPANPPAGGSSERFPGRRDEDGELAIPNRPLGSAYRGKAHRLNRASYTSVLDSDSESGSDHGIGISSDDSGSDSDFGDRDTLFAPQSRRPASYRQYLHSKIPPKPKSNSPAGSSPSRPQNPNPTLSDDDAPLAYLLPDAVELQSL